MKSVIAAWTIGILFIFSKGMTFGFWIDRELGAFDPPADRYTVAELTDAIATREATFAERAVELEGEK